jgi:hypothetical protein
MRLLPHTRTLLTASVLAALASPVCHATTASGVFNVKIALNQQATQATNSICVSATLSQQTQALVKVTCAGGQFVSIEPRPGSQFFGTHGGAWRFHFPRNTVVPQFLLGDGELQPDIGTGTITAMRVLGLQERNETLELLVSF